MARSDDDVLESTDENRVFDLTPHDSSHGLTIVEILAQEIPITFEFDTERVGDESPGPRLLGQPMNLRSPIGLQETVDRGMNQSDVVEISPEYRAIQQTRDAEINSHESRTTISTTMLSQSIRNATTRRIASNHTEP
jgi:hypothetical protein